MGELTTYFIGTEKDITLFYRDINEDGKSKHSWGAAAELIGAYLLCSAFPLTCAYLAADGLVRVVRGWNSKNPKPGLIGYARENISIDRLLKD